MPKPLLACLVLAILAGTAVPASAAFPGRNGLIAVSFVYDQEPELGPFRYESGIELRRPDRGPSAPARRVIGCTKVTGGSAALQGHCSFQYFSSPAFSPDGRWIAFATGTRIALVRADGGGLRLLPAAGGLPGNPTWSPGGGRILFDAARRPGGEGTRDLWVASATGAGMPRRVVRDASDPSWSARALIAFVRRGRVWVARSTGARSHPVSRAGASGPDFAPRGDRLVYATSRGPLTVVGADGRRRAELDAGPYDASDPAWSPDGRRLAWDTFDGPVYTGDVSGQNPRPISDAGVGGTYDFGSTAPSWQPLPRRRR